VPVKIRGLGLRVGYMRHTCDWAVRQTRMRSKFRGFEGFRSDIWHKNKSGGSLEVRRGIVTAPMTPCLA